MKKYKTLFILSLFSLVLGSCGQTPVTPPAPNRYIVMYTTSSDYTINGLKENYGYQEEVSFTVTVSNSQKEIDNVKADNDVLTPTDSLYKFSMPEHDVSLTINLKNKPLVERYRVTYTSSSEYTVNGLKEEYEVNEEVSFSITVLNSSKEVDTVIADSTSLTLIGETYKFNMPSHNVSLSITLKEKTPIPENVYPYNISYDLGTKTTAQAFNAGDEDKLLSTFVLNGKESSVISSINGFDKIYGGGNGGSGDNRWYAGDMLKFGTGSYNAYIDFELTMPVNKVKVTGLVSASSCIVRAGDPTSVEWDAASHDVDGKTSAITLSSSFNLANKTNVESKNYSTFELEFEPMTSLRFGTSSTSSSKKVLYVTSIEFYVAKINKYTVTWIDYDGSNLRVDTDVIEGTTPSYGEDPTRDGYEFIGWDPTPSPIHSDVTYTAQYVPEGAKYTITWKDYDGTLLWTSENVKVNTLPTYEGVSPRRNEDESAYYIFTGWDKVVVPATEDTTYTATYFAKDKSQQIPGFDPVKIGNTVKYGFYPQTHVSDETTVSEIEKREAINSYGIHYYDGEFYYPETAYPCNDESYTFKDGASIVKGTKYWYKLEPIQWTIYVTNSNEYLAYSRHLLSSCEFSNTLSDRTIGGQTIHPNDYKYSNLRTFLNNEFLDLAFIFSDSKIQSHEVYSGVNDKVFSLSYSDLLNSSYGFDSDPEAVSDTRTAQLTDYAKAHGSWAVKKADQHPVAKDNGSYWTISASNQYTYSTYVVNSGGFLAEYPVDTTSHSIRPCISIAL